MSEKTTKDWKKFREEELLHEEQAMDELLDESVSLEEEDTELDALTYSELKEKLILAEQKAQENWDKSVRAKAELDNGLRRAERDITNAHRYSLEKILNSLLPVVDSLEQAIQLTEQSGDRTMHEGLNLTMKLFLDVLQKYDVQQLDPQGTLFDPQQHEAMSLQESAEVPANTVLTVFQKGYKLHDRIIRPARVIVSKTKTE